MSSSALTERFPGWERDWVSLLSPLKPWQWEERGLKESPSLATPCPAGPSTATPVADLGYCASPCKQPLPNSPPRLGVPPRCVCRAPVPHNLGLAFAEEAAVFAAFGPGVQESPGRPEATWSVMGSKARRAATHLSPPAPLYTHVPWRGWTSPEPHPGLLSSHTQTPGAQNLPLPFHRLGHEALLFHLPQPWWVSNLDQLSPSWEGQSQDSLASHNPAGLLMQLASCLSAPSTPSDSLATLPPQGSLGMLS